MPGNDQFHIIDLLQHHLRHRVVQIAADIVIGQVQVIDQVVLQVGVHRTRVEMNKWIPKNIRRSFYVSDLEWCGS